MHLDPDFEHLTYGDSFTPRGVRIAQFHPGDWMVFIAGLQSITQRRPLHYAIIGKFEVAEVVSARSVHPSRAHENAHTRPIEPLASDVVIRAKPGVSGRLTNCIGIGELRGSPPRYRVRASLLELWGGLHSNDGYIQRGSPFELANPAKFIEWWNTLNPQLVAGNWN
jgi:hypothetical protein